MSTDHQRLVEIAQATQLLAELLRDRAGRGPSTLIVNEASALRSRIAEMPSRSGLTGHLLGCVDAICQDIAKCDPDNFLARIVWRHEQMRGRAGREPSNRRIVNPIAAMNATNDDFLSAHQPKWEDLARLAERLGEATGQNAAPTIASGTKQDPTLPVVNIEPDGACVIFDGSTDNGVNLTAAECLKRLIENYPHAVGIGDLCNNQPRRTIDKLPARLRVLCVSAGPAKGYRLNL